MLFNGEHEKFWEATREMLSAAIGEEAMNNGSNAKLDGFKAGHGTILFFEDYQIIRGQQEAYKLYADNFPIWASQTNGSECDSCVNDLRFDRRSRFCCLSGSIRLLDSA